MRRGGGGAPRGLKVLQIWKNIKLPQNPMSTSRLLNFASLFCLWVQLPISSAHLENETNSVSTPGSALFGGLDPSLYLDPDRCEEKEEVCGALTTS